MRNITPFSPKQIRDQGNHLGFRIDQKVTIFLLDLQSNVAGKSVELVCSCSGEIKNDSAN